MSARPCCRKCGGAKYRQHGTAIGCFGADPGGGACGRDIAGAAGPATVLLATDGFYALTDDYEVFDDRDLIATGQTLGLAAMGAQLRHIEDEDPNGQRYPRMKKSDDATALLVRVAP